MELFLPQERTRFSFLAPLIQDTFPILNFPFPCALPMAPEHVFGKQMMQKNVFHSPLDIIAYSQVVFGGLFGIVFCGECVIVEAQSLFLDV